MDIRMEPVIQLEHVTRQYPSKPTPVRALNDISLSVPRGEWLSIMGPSGSGKSTLVNLLGCLDRPTNGIVRIAGEDLSTMSAQQLDRFRADKVGFIFQQFHLIPYLTALENVMLAQYFHSITDEAEALAALNSVGLADRASHLPAQLSGGEQQRVCIARALINQPPILLADEPTGNLDEENQQIVLAHLRQLHAQGHTIVMVTHDPVMARMADRLIELQHGHIAAEQRLSACGRTQLRNDDQFDEMLEELWLHEENREPADVGRIRAPGPLPPRLLVERMSQLGLVELHPHHADHTHRDIERCHDGSVVVAALPEHGDAVVSLTQRGRRRAQDVIRRHRLAECLFANALHVENAEVVAQQACKFEHVLSPEVTDRICTFLGHPATCPHGSQIPRGPCCPQQ
jgi:putative ABC transport system ATP-binding protein